MRIALIILGIVAIVYAAFLSLLFFLQDRFLYFPRSELRTTPGDRGLRYENIHLATEDGVRLHGWYVPADSPRGVVMFCHGNAGNISGTIEPIEEFRSLGFDVLSFDYRGYGQSSGAPNEHGIYRDAERFWTWLTRERGVPEASLVLVGRSLGSGPATWLATRHKPAALILESPFTSVADLGARQFPFAPVHLLIRHRFDNLERIPHVSSPVLIIHSRDDSLIPFEMGRALYDAAPAPKEFLEIRYGHNEGFGLSAEVYRSGMVRFIQGIGLQ